MEKKYYSEHINNLIVLCHIIDDFKEFENKLLTLISTDYNMDFIFKLWDISQGKSSLFGGRVKKFYLDNKRVIDEINKYSNITAFIISNYNCSGKPNNNLKYFYEYILSHKEEIDKILIVLNKLEELGFKKINFNDKVSFAEEVYDVCVCFSQNDSVTYLNNLEIIPNYNPGVISYKTTGSNYKMIVGVNSDDFKKRTRNIYLNSLIFNIDELPKGISKKEIFERIITLREEKNNEFSFIKDSVNLGVGIMDLYKIHELVSLKIESLDNVKKKDELIRLLEDIKEMIIHMHAISIEYNKSIFDEFNITEEFLEEQKKDFVKRREFDDFCY